MFFVVLSLLVMALVLTLLWLSLLVHSLLSILLYILCEAIAVHALPKLFFSLLSTLLGKYQGSYKSHHHQQMQEVVDTLTSNLSLLVYCRKQLPGHLVVVFLANCLMHLQANPTICTCVSFFATTLSTGTGSYEMLHLSALLQFVDLD